MLWLIVLVPPSQTFAQSVTVGNFTLSFEGASYDRGKNSSTWCYTLVWNGTPPELSHLTIQLGPCAQVISATPAGFQLGFEEEEDDDLYLHDSTRFFGIKWETTIPANTPTPFCFTLDGLYAPDTVKFAVKAGREKAIAQISGSSPSCETCQVQIICPSGLSLDCADQLDTINTGIPQVQGNCPPLVVSFSDEQRPGICGSAKTILRTWTVTDNSGSKATCQQLFSLQDTQAPNITCTPAKTIFHPDTLSFDTPQVSDNCDSNPIIKIISTVGSVSDCPHESIYTRTWQAVDACGNLSAPCSQTISYKNRAPQLTLSNDKTVIRNDTLVISLSAFDPDGTVPVLTALNLPLNSKFTDNLNGTGSFVFAPDNSQEGIHPHLTFMASDGCLADTEIIAVNVFIRHDTLSINGYSPINLVVIDPKQDSIGINFNTILEGSSYDTTQDVNGDGEKDDIVKIPNPYLGEYRVKVIPEDTGLFSLGIRIDGNDEVRVASNVVIPTTDTVFEYKAEVFPTLRGDMNRDTKINLIDIIFLVNFIFKGGPASQPLALSNLNCDKKADGTDNVTLQDIIYLVNYVFKGGPHPCS